MKLYSDKLERGDIVGALPPGVHLWHCVELPRTRKRARGWEISLSGSSPHMSQCSFTEPHRAATWTEHGVWMAALFAIDPDACISWYDGRDAFMRQTAEFAEHDRKRGATGPTAHVAPWVEGWYDEVENEVAEACAR